MPARKPAWLRIPLVSIPLAMAASLLWAVPAQAATFTVSTTSDTADGSCDADCSLREAISAANETAEADTIVVPAGTYMLSLAGAGEGLNATGDLDILQPVTISGAGASTTIIDGNGSVVMDRVVDVGATAPTTMSGVTIQNGISPQDGGGIRASAALTLSDVIVGGNTSTTGGGGIATGADLTLTDVSVSGNASGTGGGGIAVSGTTVVTRTTFDGNVAGTGGGGITSSGALTVTNATLSGNDAATGGGGIATGVLATTTVNNVTISGNTADQDASGSGNGGGVSAGGTFTVANTIIAGNTDASPDGEAPDCDGIVTSSGYNLIGTNEGCGFAAATGDLVGTTAAPIDPMLGPLADNGGATRTMALLTGSSAIDTGNPAQPGSGFPVCEANDQRNFVRTGRCDIGAYEAGAGPDPGPDPDPDPDPDPGPGTGPQPGPGVGVVKCLKRAATIVGTDGKDVLVGTKGNDVIAGLGQKDRIRGKGGRDRICGGRGNDVLRGAGGNDRLNGQKGRRDVCIGGPGRDRGRCERERRIP
jgi:CSLREA domain-containing protein